MPTDLRFLSRIVLWALLLAASPSTATVYEIFPTGMTSNCNEEFENLANELQPGDELILHDGIYAQGCARRININGTPSQPILIRAAAGASPLITRPPETSTSNNNIELSGSHYTIRGLRFQYGSAGVRFLASNNITFEANEIFDTLNNALTMNQGDTDSHIIRGNHIHDTGLAEGSTEGEGMYIGAHNGNHVATNHLIENNYIHHLRATSDGGNDGIEIKFGSGGNIIRGNVIHDTNIGRMYPCIFVYGHGSAPNIVENNTVYNCGEAILATADAIIRNNVVLNSAVNGIHLNRQNPAPSIRNVAIVNNTVYGHPVCAQLNIGSAPGIVVANNAFYCEGATAVTGNGFSGANISSNYVSGSMNAGAIIDNSTFHAGGSSSNAFLNPSAGDFRLAEGSVLIDSGNAAVDGVGSIDIDGNARVAGSIIDVGAYESGGEAIANPPQVNLAGPTTIASSGSATLQWTSTDADSCIATGDWSGEKPSAGSQIVGPLTSDSVFVLICTGPGGVAEDAHAVAVTQPSNDNDADGLPDTWEMSNFGDLSKNAAGDADNDGASNGAEFENATDPMDSDSDDDGLDDGIEINGTTDPLDADSDDDSYSDGEEVAAGTDPKDSGSFPQSAGNDGQVADADSSESGGGAFSLWSIALLMLLARRRRDVRLGHIE